MTNKYNARKVTIDGYTFDSQREGKRYDELKLLVRAGEITDLRIHPKYKLIPSVMVSGKKKGVRHYVADFEYIENGKVVVEDVKGYITKLADWKMQQFQWQYPKADFRIVK